jgi:hypothetical protein
VNRSNVHLAEIEGLASHIGNHPQQGAESIQQLMSSFFGEGTEENLAWWNAFKNNQIQNAPEQNPGFTRPWSGNQIKRALNMEDSLSLLGCRLVAFLLPQGFDIDLTVIEDIAQVVC